jgi:hypothetical protein
MTSSQELSFNKDTTNTANINEINKINGCDLTHNPLLDLFANKEKYSTRKCPNDFKDFFETFKIVSSSLKEEPDTFIKVLKFQENVQNKSGIKWIYYLCLLMIKMENPLMYEEILNWSWQYPKDFLNLHRITNMYEPIYSTETVKIQLPTTKCAPKGTYANRLNAWVLQNGAGRYETGILWDAPLQTELVMYAKKVLNLFVNLMTPEFNSDYNPFLIKYMSYETGYWQVETHLIWQYLEKLIKTNENFVKLIISDLELKNDLGMKLRAILKKSIGSFNDLYEQIFTNKIRRNIKQCFNSHIILTDRTNLNTNLNTNLKTNLNTNFRTDLNEQSNSFNVGTYSKDYDYEEIIKLFSVFMKNFYQPTGNGDNNNDNDDDDDDNDDVNSNSNSNSNSDTDFNLRTNFLLCNASEFIGNRGIGRGR